MRLPVEIKQYIQSMIINEVKVGCTQAKVYKCFNVSTTYYLKIDKVNDESIREMLSYIYLQDKLKVPKLIKGHQENGYIYLLLSPAEGEMAISDKHLNNQEETVKYLAKGIINLHKLKISECPFVNRLDDKLKKAKYNIENNLITDVKRYDFTSIKEIYNYLITNKPKEELVITHGDFCLPNIFITDNGEVSYIDLGRFGVSDLYQDIALCLRSMEYNFKSDKYNKLLFTYLNITPDYEKIKYYILLDELL